MIAKTLKGKISQEAYIAVLEDELEAMYSIVEINKKYDGIAIEAMTAGVTIALHCNIRNIVRADKSKPLDGDSFIVQEVK